MLMNNEQCLNMLNPVKVRCPFKHCRLRSRGIISLDYCNKLINLKKHFLRHKERDAEAVLAQVLLKRLTVLEENLDKLQNESLCRDLLDHLNSRYPIDDPVQQLLCVTEESNLPCRSYIAPVEKE